MEQGLSQKEFAKMVGVDEMTVVNWETGKTRPVPMNIKRLSKIMEQDFMGMNNIP